MMTSSVIKSECGDIDVDVSDYGSYWFIQEDQSVEFKARDIQYLIAALERLASFL